MSSTVIVVTASCMMPSSSASVTGCSVGNTVSRSKRRRMSDSSSGVGYPRISLRRNLSSWASGRGKVPSISMGFWVAITRKGSGSAMVTPSMVACLSCIASKRADWVLGVARFISSAKTICENMGPALNSKSLTFWLKKLTPSTSLGMRSGVYWILVKVQPRDWAKALAIIVLPMPGTSSMSTCPRHRSAMMARSITSSLPTIIRCTLSRSLAAISWTLVASSCPAKSLSSSCDSARGSGAGSGVSIMDAKPLLYPTHLQGLPKDRSTGRNLEVHWSASSKHRKMRTTAPRSMSSDGLRATVGVTMVPQGRVHPARRARSGHSSRRMRYIDKDSATHRGPPASRRPVNAPANAR